MAELQELPGETPPDGATESIDKEPESKAQLERFAAEATAKYAIKDYDAAAELFSQATELQARINGEMSPQNADLLYAYGRCLYHLALRNSDVLGPKVAGEAQAEESKASSSKKQSNQSKSAASADEPATGEASSTDVKNNGADEDSNLGVKKPLFQFTGDENFDDSDDEDELASGGVNGKEGGEAEEDPEDDFANAYEVLDLARILLLKRIEELHEQEGVLEGNGKGKANTSSEAMCQLKERLADTHDLQAEISLEGERFPAAVTDLKEALDLKKELFPESSSLVAEAHYKLSLALEFSSVTRQKDPEGGENEKNQVQQVDVAMREEAANEMEAAIQSCKLRIQVELERLNSGGEGKGAGQHSGKKVTKVDIDDVKDMVEEMEQRVYYLPYIPSLPPLPASYLLSPTRHITIKKLIHTFFSP